MIIKTKVGVLEHEPRRLNGEDNDEICGAHSSDGTRRCFKKDGRGVFRGVYHPRVQGSEEHIYDPGIGKLVLANRKARVGRNPQTGETIKIAARRVVKFRVAKAAKDVVLGKR
jgi:hypothetical protein